MSALKDPYLAAAVLYEMDRKIVSDGCSSNQLWSPTWMSSGVALRHLISGIYYLGDIVINIM